MLTKNDERIADLEDWGRRAGPKSDVQWKAGRSAMEAARAWLAVTSPELPPEVASAFHSHAAFGAVTSWHGEPEVRLSLDGRRGETRNTDLLLEAHDASGAFLVAVEAKADESFDRTMSEVLVAALEAKVASSASGALDRAAELAVTLLHRRNPGTRDLGTLRYQLFAAAVGVLREAERRGITRAVLLVQEFVSDETRDDKHAANTADLNAWLERVSGGQFVRLDANAMVGPITVPEGPLVAGTAQLFVGKAVRNIRVVGV
jgi:hypothetical protein